VVAHAPLPSTQRLAVASVAKCETRAPVYDIAVEGEPEFFANGILVHNCDETAKWRRMQDAWDMLRFALRLGASPQTLVTTTPTPAKLIKDLVREASPDGTVRISRGSTYANAANLSPKFLDELRKKYEGTRLGRQELHGEILEDRPGALWTYKNLDENRINDPTQVPDLVRLVVAIDPPITSGEDADECGIIAAGVSANRHGYVLQDASERGLSPKQWAEKALRVYVDLEADCIVAEANQGGEMARQVIRDLDANVPIKLVWTGSRGKVLRAEPVSNLYEQGRVHHVGTFKALEDQQTDFVTDFDRKTAGYSPDRLDALVWAITELMLGNRARGSLVGTF
jgi:phage terminase large subunit-like protein